MLKESPGFLKLKWKMEKSDWNNMQNLGEDILLIGHAAPLTGLCDIICHEVLYLNLRMNSFKKNLWDNPWRGNSLLGSLVSLI